MILWSWQQIIFLTLHKEQKCPLQNTKGWNKVIIWISVKQEKNFCWHSVQHQVVNRVQLYNIYYRYIMLRNVYLLIYTEFYIIYICSYIHIKWYNEIIGWQSLCGQILTITWFQHSGSGIKGNPKDGHFHLHDNNSVIHEWMFFKYNHKVLGLSQYQILIMTPSIMDMVIFQMFIKC